MHARQILARKAALHGVIGAHAEEHRIVTRASSSSKDDIARRPRTPSRNSHAHAFHDLAALLHHLLLELEGRDAEGQQSADARVAIEHHRLARRCAPGCRRSASPAGPAPTIATRLSVGRTPDMSGCQPCLSASSVMYFSIEPMVTAPRPSLSVQAPSHSRSCGQMRPHTSGQRVGLVRQLGRLEQLALLDQLQPVGDVVVDRAFPFAERIAARQAAAGLLRGAVRRRRAHRSRWKPAMRVGSTGDLLRLGARELEELQVLVDHGVSAPSGRAPQVLDQRVDRGRLGLHQPELGRGRSAGRSGFPRPRRCRSRRRAC